MAMVVEELSAIVAEHTGVPRGRVRMVARRLAEFGVLPTGAGGRSRPIVTIEHAALLLIGVLVDRPLHSVAEATIAYATLTNAETGASLKGALFKMLVDLARDYTHAKRLAGVSAGELSPISRMAFHSLVDVCSTRPEVRITTATTDGDPIEVAFTDGAAKFEPHLETQLRRSLSLSGRVLLRVACALKDGNCAPVAGYDFNIERRTVPATFRLVEHADA